jgi:hypothetical protein
LYTVAGETAGCTAVGTFASGWARAAVEPGPAMAATASAAIAAIAAAGRVLRTCVISGYAPW